MLTGDVALVSTDSAMSNRSNVIIEDHGDSSDEIFADTAAVTSNADNGMIGATVDLNQSFEMSTTTSSPNPNPVIVNEIMLPNGQVMNAKTSLQSFDNTTPISRSIVAAAINIRSKMGTVDTDEPRHTTGQSIRAKNTTTRSYEYDVENQGSTGSSNDNRSIRNEMMVEAEVIGDHPNQRTQQDSNNEVTVEAYVVQSFVTVKSEPLLRLSKRMICILSFVILFGSLIIGTGVYCGLGKCSSPSQSSLSETRKQRPDPVPLPSPVMSPSTFSERTTITKAIAITEYINSITLSNRTIRVNGSTAEDLALSWIIYNDPIFNDIADSTWSTITTVSGTTATDTATKILIRQRYALLSLWFQQTFQQQHQQIGTAGNNNQSDVVVSQQLLPQWYNTTGWLQNYTECFWHGVHCNTIDMGGFVGVQRIIVEIDFYNDDNDNNENGGRNGHGNNITATIPPDFGLLTSLNRIDLSYNHFHGTLPESIFQHWDTIASVNVGNNNISGTIPASIGQCTNARIINIANNRLSGTIPMEIGQCTTIERFDAGMNLLTGSLPNTIGQWTILQNFNVQSNALTGTVPISIKNWTSLSDFYIYKNQFRGTIPNIFDSWNMLQTFNIEYNMFTGTITNSIEQLTNVKRLDFSDNLLTGNIPESIGNCTSLVFFSIEDNAFSGPIPETIGMLTALTGLFLYSNQLTGTLPNVIGQLESLKYIGVENNQLTGTIPLSVGNWSDIVSVQLYNNSFTGIVPYVLCTFMTSNMTTNITADCDLDCYCCSVCVK